MLLTQFLQQFRSISGNFYHMFDVEMLLVLYSPLFRMFRLSAVGSRRVSLAAAANTAARPKSTTEVSLDLLSYIPLTLNIHTDERRPLLRPTWHTKLSGASQFNLR